MLYWVELNPKIYYSDHSSLRIFARNLAWIGFTWIRRLQEATRGLDLEKALIPDDHISCLSQEHLQTGKEEDLIFRP